MNRKNIIKHFLPLCIFIMPYSSIAAQSLSERPSWLPTGLNMHDCWARNDNTKTMNNRLCALMKYDRSYLETVTLTCINGVTQPTKGDNGYPNWRVWSYPRMEGKHVWSYGSTGGGSGGGTDAISPDKSTHGITLVGSALLNNKNMVAQNLIASYSDIDITFPVVKAICYIDSASSNTGTDFFEYRWLLAEPNICNEEGYIYPINAQQIMENYDDLDITTASGRDIRTNPGPANPNECVRVKCRDGMKWNFNATPAAKCVSTAKKEAPTQKKSVPPKKEQPTYTGKTKVPDYNW